MPNEVFKLVRSPALSRVTIRSQFSRPRIIDYYPQRLANLQNPNSFGFMAERFFVCRRSNFRVSRVRGEILDQENQRRPCKGSLRQMPPRNRRANSGIAGIYHYVAKARISFRMVQTIQQRCLPRRFRRSQRQKVPPAALLRQTVRKPRSIKAYRDQRVPFT